MSERSWRQRAERVLLRPWPPSCRAGPEAAGPTFYHRAYGARLIDEDGREWLDLEMGRGPNLLGYAHPRIEEAMRRLASIGAAHTSLLHRSEVEVAELVCAAIPGCERVIFAKNGSDACSAAVRAARIATGRNVVLSSGYHGFHDWYVAELGHFRGFPPGYRGHLASFELNDLKGLEALAEQYAGDVACIFIEPAHRLLPKRGFLKAARRIADRCGALLVFDEVVTAFRLHIGGAQAAYGVGADLICLGKAMANGLPLSALAGRADALAHLRETHFSMTFQHGSPAFVAAAACLDHMRDGSVARRVAEHGEQIRHAFDTAARRYGLPARALGFPARLDFEFPDAGTLDGTTQANLFKSGLLAAGVLPTLACFACEMLRPADLDRAAGAFDLGMQRIATERRNGARR